MDTKYMKQAIELAKKGCGYVSPNPMVGAVIVKNGETIGRGWHEHYGGLHAERNALADCRKSPEGATIYVTLEPCCHYGKTPPCTEAIIESGIARVVIGSSDPNPLVAGKGIALLRQHGIEVTEHILETECNLLNEVFFHYIQKKTPYVVMKYAMTMDGKIATAEGLSKWITGKEARSWVQRDRHRYSGIMAGVGTILADDPLLTCRIEGGVNPIRIICDTKLRTPLDSQVVRTAREVKTWIATACKKKEKCQAYEEFGCELIYLPLQNEHIDLKKLMEELGKREVDSILLEGGGALNWSALECGIVKVVQTYIAPKIFGSDEAKTPVRGPGVKRPEDAFPLKIRAVIPVGEDLLVESEVVSSCLLES